MLRALLSDDLPRSRWLAFVLVAIVIGLAFAPFLFPGAKSLNVAAKICVFIVVIIGGLGSVGGCFVGALLVGLTANYIGFLAPKVALGSNILLMALVLLWRPQGLYPVAKR